jgi:hypothetical protein
MKTFIKLLLLILFLSFNSCSKKDNCDNPVDCLPPATQTGEGTIGCLVNGEVFKPGGSQFPGPTQQVSYDFVNGAYSFGLSANNRISNENLRIFIRNQVIKENDIYILKTDEENSNVAEYENKLVSYKTNEINSGEIKFTKFDDINGIVSGTFWFDAINEDGEVVEIREGRFDMKYN